MKTTVSRTENIETTVPITTTSIIEEFIIEPTPDIPFEAEILLP